MWAVTVLMWAVVFLLLEVIAAMWAVTVPIGAVIAVWALKGVFGPAYEKTLKIASLRSTNLSSDRKTYKIIKLPRSARQISANLENQFQ